MITEYIPCLLEKAIRPQSFVTTPNLQHKENRFETDNDALGELLYVAPRPGFTARLEVKNSFA